MSIKEMVEEAKENSGYLGYEDIIKIAFKAYHNVTPEFLVNVDEGSYQGDSLIIAKDENGQYYYVQWGWGSCSGCDLLESVSGQEWEAVEAMRSSITPIVGKTVEQYLKNEYQNSWNKELITQALQEWRKLQK